MKAKRLVALLLTTVLVIGMTGCQVKEESASAAPEAGSSAATGQPQSKPVETAALSNSTGDEITIGVLMKTMSDTYSNKLGTAIENYAAETYPNVKQISQAEDLIAKQVDIIILNPQDADGSSQVLDLCAAANIPVIEVNNATLKDDYLSFVGSNDVEAGEIMGNYVDEKLGGSGNLVLLEGLMGESGQLYRREGLENTILAKDGYELLSELSAEWSRAKAMSITEDWLGKYPQIDAILCENDDMAMGALQAAESSERDPLIIGVDAIPDALQAVKDGRMDATILQDAQGQAQVSVDVAVKIVNGESVEKEYSVPFQLITSENVDQFMEP